VASHKSHGDFDHEAKARGREDAKVEEEDREFGNVLDKGVEYLADIIELKISAIVL
jgi:hypothetical protein